MKGGLVLGNGQADVSVKSSVGFSTDFKTAESPFSHAANWPFSGKIVLHLLIIGILGWNWDRRLPVGIHPKFVPSQTPTNHPFSFLNHIVDSVPKRKKALWRKDVIIEKLKVNYNFGSIQKSESECAHSDYPHLDYPQLNQPYLD